MDIKGNIATFDSELVRETVYSSDNLGMFKNQMEFQKAGHNAGQIIWNFGVDAPDEDEEVIGVWFDGMELIDYDGVFEMPTQAIELLESIGYNCDYAKD